MRFEISYQEDLNRIIIRLNHPNIVNLARNSDTQTMDVLPTIIDGTMLLPVKFVDIDLGAEVEWNEDTRGVTLSTEDAELTFYIGEPTVGMRSVN